MIADKQKSSCLAHMLRLYESTIPTIDEGSRLPFAVACSMVKAFILVGCFNEIFPEEAQTVEHFNIVSAPDEHRKFIDYIRKWIL